MREIRVLEAKDADQLNALRTSAYRDRYGDKVDFSALRWNAKLHNTLDLGLFESEALISAYRMDRVSDQAQAEFLLQTKFEVGSPLSKLVYPFALGCRACTRTDRQNHGYHFVLRLAAIEVAMETRASHIASTFSSDSPWTQSLRSAGYEVFESTGRWDDFIKSASPASIGILDLRSQGLKAVESLRRKVEDSIVIGGLLGPAESWGRQLSKMSPRVQRWIDSF